MINPKDIPVSSFWTILYFPLELLGHISDNIIVGHWKILEYLLLKFITICLVLDFTFSAGYITGMLFLFDCFYLLFECDDEDDYASDIA